MEHRMTLYPQSPDRGRTSACTEAGRKITLIATPPSDQRGIAG